MQNAADRERKISLWEKGVEYGERAVKVNPEGKEGHFYLMSNMGSLARSKGALSSLWKFRRIKKEMDKTLALDPNFPPVLVARAQYLTEMPSIFGGDEAEAIRLYKRALEVDPDYRIAYYYLAKLYRQHKRYDEAIASLNMIIHCQESHRSGNWAKIDLPWAEKLLAEILKEKAEKEAGQ